MQKGRNRTAAAMPAVPSIRMAIREIFAHVPRIAIKMDEKQGAGRSPMRGERMSLRSPNNNICFKIGISRAIDKDDFIHAIDLLSMRHPIIRIAVDVDADNNAWYMPGACSVGVEFFLAGDAGAIGWLEWYIKTDNTPFDFLNGPLLKIGVFMASDISDIVIIGNHALGDGIGYINLLRDLLLALDGRLDATPQLPYEGNRFRVDIKSNYFIKIFAKYLNKTWKASNRKRISEEEYETFFKEYRLKYPPKIHHVSIKEPELSQLLSACKKMKITVNEAISAALVASIQKSAGKPARPPIKLSVAASIRKDLINPDITCMGNYITAISAKIRYNGKKNFADNSMRIAEILRKKLNNKKSRYLPICFFSELDADFIESSLYAAYGNYKNAASQILAGIIGEGVGSKGFGLTNLGKQDFGEFDSFSVMDFVFLPPAYPAHIINTGVITVNGQLDFCYSYSNTDISDAQVKQIGAMAVEHLHELF